ncbi:MAG: tetratricopeptide repeat protein [Candidatus Omnitrophica bacterium]|nr:tetratricopeptide repeat protein [Candidatus Omnitrophota bacterium]
MRRFGKPLSPPRHLFKRRSGAWSDGTARSARRKRGSSKWIPAFAGMTWFFFSSLCVAGIIEDAFFEANKLYSNGEYAKAAERYEDILKGGVESGHLHYNLGNTYFKLGKKGKALAAYERAKKLIPGDEDLFANIRFVTSLLEEEQPGERLPWYGKAFAVLRDILPSGGWFAFILVLYYALAIVLGMAIFNRSFRKKLAIPAALIIPLLLISVVLYRDRVNAVHHSRYGVVAAPEAEVRYSPSYSGAVAFKLHEGIRAQIVRYQDEWTQIRLTRDKSGWIESAAIEEI